MIRSSSVLVVVSVMTGATRKSHISHILHRNRVLEKYAWHKIHYQATDKPDGKYWYLFYNFTHLNKILMYKIHQKLISKTIMLY